MLQKKKKKEDNIYSKEDICCVDERLILKPSGVCQQNSLRPTDVIFQSLWSCLKGIDLSQKNKNIHHKKTEDNSTCSHFQRWKQTLFGISARWNTYRVRTPGGGAFLCRLCFHFWPRATPERHATAADLPPLRPALRRTERFLKGFLFSSQFFRYIKLNLFSFSPASPVCTFKHISCILLVMTQ